MRERHRTFFARLEASARQQLKDFRISSRVDGDIDKGLERKYLDARFRHRVVDAPLTLGVKAGFQAIRSGASTLAVVRRILQFAAPTLYWLVLRLIRRRESKLQGTPDPA